MHDLSSGKSAPRVNKSPVDFGYKMCDYTLKVIAKTETGKAARMNVFVAFLLRTRSSRKEKNDAQTKLS
jgi:hypothetical protein